jgi:hypothetical protein
VGVAEKPADGGDSGQGDERGAAVDLGEVERRRKEAEALNAKRRHALSVQLAARRTKTVQEAHTLRAVEVFSSFFLLFLARFLLRCWALCTPHTWRVGSKNWSS